MDISVLKTHLGDELFAQVEEKVGSLEGYNIIATNDGTWLPKSRLDAEIEKRKQLQTTINGLTGELNTAKQQLAASETLQAQVTQLTSDVAERDKTIAALKISGKVHSALAKENAKDVDLVERLLDHSKIAEDDKGNVTGLDDQIKALKESSPYLFGTEEKPGQRGGFVPGRNPNAHESGDSHSNADVNAAIRAAAGRKTI